jgi:hypothetical protein
LLLVRGTLSLALLKEKCTLGELNPMVGTELRKKKLSKMMETTSQN